jgi:hypothetical protein
MSWIQFWSLRECSAELCGRLIDGEADKGVTRFRAATSSNRLFLASEKPFRNGELY